MRRLKFQEMMVRTDGNITIELPVDRIPGQVFRIRHLGPPDRHWLAHYLCWFNCTPQWMIKAMRRKLQ